MSAFARVNKSMYTQDGFVLPKLKYKRRRPPFQWTKKTAFASSARGRAVAPWPGDRGPALRRAAPRCFAGRDSSQTERNSPGLHGAVPVLAARPSLGPFWAFLAAPLAAWSRASASCVGAQGRGLKQGPSRFKA